MKKLLLSMTALATLATGVAATPAAAAPWQSIRDRHDNLDRRIDQGVRNGSLTRAEATNLRNRYIALTRLEWRYRNSNGLSNWERRDLDQRYDALSRSVRWQKHDGQNQRPWRR